MYFWLLRIITGDINLKRMNEEWFQRYRHIQLLVGILNKYREYVLSLILLVAGLAVIASSAAIIRFQLIAFPAKITLLMIANNFTIYLILLLKLSKDASRTSELALNSIRKEFLNASFSFGLITKIDALYYKKLLKSIPRLYLKHGALRHSNRNTILVAFDTIVNCIISILVAKTG